MITGSAAPSYTGSTYKGFGAGSKLCAEENEKAKRYEHTNSRPLLISQGS
jgi:hypothetical protein